MVEERIGYVSLMLKLLRGTSGVYTKVVFVNEERRGCVEGPRTVSSTIVSSGSSRLALRIVCVVDYR